MRIIATITTTTPVQLCVGSYHACVVQSDGYHIAAPDPDGAGAPVGRSDASGADEGWDLDAPVARVTAEDTEGGVIARVRAAWERRACNVGAISVNSPP